MQRHALTVRPGWQTIVERVGLTYHSHEHGPYWDESSAYELTAQEVDLVETAGNTVHKLCLDAINAILEHEWWHRLHIPEAAIPLIRQSWERDDFSLYGRFDFAFDGASAPKLLEYNADTPTALVEAAVAQWFWLQDVFPEADQFNSIHERLIEAWCACAVPVIHFSSVKEHPEDEQTVLYLRDTCEQAGLSTRSVYMDDIGWDAKLKRFVDLDGIPIEHCFKLYPWEWLWQEEFSAYLPDDCVRLIEPPWKMLLSNKGLLPILWELFPDHPNLLPCYESSRPLGGNYVRKPKLSREGANVTWVEDSHVVENTEGDYGAEGYVYQALAPIPEFDGERPVFGVWMIEHEAAGLGIRADKGRVTGNLSRFVPHFFSPSPQPQATHQR